MVHIGDAIEALRKLSPGSVDLLLSDLPSGETRADFDVAPQMELLWPKIWLAVKPSGIVVLMASSLRFASRLSQHPTFRYDLIWHKSLATGQLNAGYRPLRAHEFILVFSGQLKGVYNPQRLEGASPIHAARRKSHGENYGAMTAETESRAGATDRFPTSVLEFASVGTTALERVHPQQKPVPLLRWLIETYSNPGDLVVDPYAGSGSTGVAAEACGRRFMGWDNNPRFGKISVDSNRVKV
jgi:DNA modification methylase